jgi:hypothetical protein
MTGLSLHSREVLPSTEWPSNFVGFDSFYRWSHTCIFSPFSFSLSCSFLFMWSWPFISL